MILFVRVLKYALLAGLVFVLSFYTHNYALWTLERATPYDLQAIYLFHLIFSGLICIAFELLYSLSTHYKDQLGFIYLGTLVLKIVLFYVVFRGFLFSEVALSRADSLSLLIPLFIFLFFEVFIIAKILNRTP